MTLELFSTSASTGLEPGSSGYCTVAMTRGLPRALAEQLDSLSAYRPAFMPGDPRELENPVVWSHLRVVAAGKTYTVLSRTCFAGLDHTNRTNRFAHHVVLDGNDARPAGGPAWLLMQDGFLEDFWDGQVKWLNGGRRVPQGDLPGLGCPTWAMRTGDAGWAGFVLEKLLEGQTLYLVADAELDLLPLVAEAIALLPGPQRWNVTFSTYFTGLPHGTQCSLRGVLRGSPEAQSAPRSATLDLAALAGRTPPDSDWVEVARGNRRMPAPVQTPMHAPVPAPLGYRPVVITPMENGEGELYVEDGPVWRKPMEGPPPLVPMPPPGPVLVPVAPPEADLETEEQPEREAKRRVGLGVLAGAGIGVLLLGVIGLGGVVLFGDKIRARLANGDKDRNPPVVSNDDKSKGRDKDNGGAPVAGNIDVGQLTLELFPVVKEGKADETKTPLTIQEGQTIQLRVTLSPLISDQSRFPWDKVAFRIEGKPLAVKAVKDNKGVVVQRLYRAEAFAQAGTYQITASLPADVKGYTAKESAAVMLKVEPAPVAVQFGVKLPSKPLLPGQTFDIVLEGKHLNEVPEKLFPTKKFTFQLDGKPFSEVEHVSGRKYQGKAPNSRGKHQVVAKFEGGKRFAAASSKPAEFHVDGWKPRWKIAKKPKEPGPIREGKAVVEVEFDAEKENPLGLKPDGLLVLQVKTDDEKFRDVGKPQKASDKVSFPIEKLGDGKHEFRVEYRSNNDAHDGGVTPVAVVKLESPKKETKKEIVYRGIKPESVRENSVWSFVPKDDKEKRKIQGAVRLDSLPADGQFVFEFERSQRKGSDQLPETARCSPSQTATKVIGDDGSIELMNSRDLTIQWTSSAVKGEKTRLISFGIGQNENKEWFVYHRLAEKYDLSKRTQLHKDDKEKLFKGFREAVNNLHECRLKVYEAEEVENKQTKAKELKRIDKKEPILVIRIDRGLSE